MCPSTLPPLEVASAESLKAEEKSREDYVHSLLHDQSNSIHVETPYPCIIILHNTHTYA